MSVLRPVGPLPPRVYWVRRIAVLVACLVVLLLAAWAWGALSADDAQPAGGSPAPSGASSLPPAQSPSPSSTASTAPSSSTSPEPSRSASEPGPCADAAIEVTATPDRTSYGPGQDPRFTVKVTNTSKQSCERDVGQKAMEVKVSQGEKLIWSSDHCAPGGEAKVVLLKAGDSYVTSVIWSRTTSKAGCPSGQPDAAPGTYALTGRNLKVVSQAVAFALSE